MKLPAPRHKKEIKLSLLWAAEARRIVGRLDSQLTDGGEFIKSLSPGL
jgi:hypothetical protein